MITSKQGAFNAAGPAAAIALRPMLPRPRI
jgi:hypothetical protein